MHLQPALALVATLALLVVHDSCVAEHPQSTRVTGFSDTKTVDPVPSTTSPDLKPSTAAKNQAPSTDSNHGKQPLAAINYYLGRHGGYYPEHDDHDPNLEKYYPRHDDYHPKHEEYYPKHDGYHPKHEEYYHKHNYYHPKHDYDYPKHGSYYPKPYPTPAPTDLCKNVTCPASPDVCKVNICNDLDGQCNLSNVKCPVLPGPSTQVVQIQNASNFAAATGIITFSEQPVGTINPPYTPADYNATLPNAPNVTFKGFFLGQSLSANPDSDCPGGSASGCVVGVPQRPLTLDPNSPNIFINTDGANPTSPVLSGTPLFNGPIAVLFSTPVVGFGLAGGFFNDFNATAITAYDENGTELLRVTNRGLGIEFLGLSTNDGSALIKGVLFSLVGAEPAGYAIDNVQFTYGCCG